jgi:hypothetical protein
MRYRCYQPSRPSYIYYGARGITVCEEWQKREPFLKWCDETFIEGRTLDRIDNDGPYAPWNCRWATAKQQNSNKRVTEKRLIASRLSMKKAIIANVAMMAKKYGALATRRKKFCPGCKIKLFLKHFNVDNSRPDKLTSYCRECGKQRCLNYYFRKKGSSCE